MRGATHERPAGGRRSLAARLACACVAACLVLTSTPCDSLPQAHYGREALERESYPAAYKQHYQPELGRQQQPRQLVAHLSRTNGRVWGAPEPGDLFQCVEPTRELFELFARQYNRTFADAQDKLDRLNLFAVTLKRAILFNKIIQNEILNNTNYQVKPEIRNYHFVEPMSGQNAAIWYADITDCELGLIKKTLFDIFYHIDNNDYAEAHRVLRRNREHLAGLENDDGFEQLATILLLRLFDRLRADEQMDQLFKWPLYLKKLAAFVYNQRQEAQLSASARKSKMALVAFAYPAYFKDLKYNLAAINRTDDNLRAHLEHELYNAKLRRSFANLAERNKRLVIFRQRWSLIEQLNAPATTDRDNTNNNEPNDQPDSRPRPGSLDTGDPWRRVQYNVDGELPVYEYNATQQPDEPARSARLEASAAAATGEPASFSNQVANSQQVKHFKLTQFSDLTDAEFVAFLSNDFSLLAASGDSGDFLERNFPVEPLSSRLRWELAHELELRRGLAQAGGANPADQQQQQQLAADQQLRLARQVVDELISDVGLPIGPVDLDNISEEQHYRLFHRLTQVYRKSYASEGALSPGKARPGGSELAEEKQRRYLIFKQNHGRFRAWMIKEGLQLDEAESIKLLRYADMSWLELKLTLFRVCCLTGANLDSLSAQNATIEYLASNYEHMCHEFGSSPEVPLSIGAAVGAASATGRTGAAAAAAAASDWTRASAGARDGFELYYYYSVHFNKHQTIEAEFQRRQEIFKRNIDAIRRHSCTRSLTLYESFHLKRPDLLATIDVIDPRRSHLDDLNLDRFEYFRLPSHTDDLVAAPTASQAAREPKERADASRADANRASISYKRDRFAGLLDDEQLPGHQHQEQPSGSFVSYADKLVDLSENSNEFVRRYRANRVERVYDLVMARYKFCMRNYAGVDLDSSDLRQQCQTTGPLADGARGPLGGTAGGHLFASLEEPSGRLRSAATGQPQDRCSYYRQGLDSWSAGLIRQNEFSVDQIQRAACS